MTNASNEIRMMRFLLGEMPEEERLAVEREFFANDDRYQELLAFEDELVYRYLQEELSPEERRAFELRYLQSEAGARKVAFARSLLAKVTAKPASPARSGWMQWLLMPRPVWAFAMAAIALIGIAGSVWISRQGEDLLRKFAQLEAESPTPRLNQPTTAPAIQAAFFVLTPGLTRSDELRLLELPAGASVLSLRLQFNVRVKFQKYTATLRTAGGAEVWSGHHLEARSSGVELSIPAERIPPGKEEEYELRLQGEWPTGRLAKVGMYHFLAIRHSQP